MFLEVAGDNQVQVRMRRRINTEAHYWHARYIGQPELNPSCPTIVRKTIDSYMFSLGMMEFVKALGLRIDYEYFMEGVLFTKGNIRVSSYYFTNFNCLFKITISQISYTEKTGHYEREFRKQLGSGSNLVEVSAVIPENQDYVPAAKAVREFADQLSPLVEMQKFDYTKEL
jgi:hypothetical protein